METPKTPEKNKIVEVSQKLIDVLFKEKLSYQEAGQAIQLLNQALSVKLGELAKGKFINE